MCFLNWSNYTPGIDTVYNVPPKASARVCFLFQKSHLDAVEYVIKFPPFSPSPSSKEKRTGSQHLGLLLPPANEVAGGQCFQRRLPVHRRGCGYARSQVPSGGYTKGRWAGIPGIPPGTDI